ncbi:MAG: Uma2 family endonuclease [Acidobacteriota bacterium]
MPTVASQVAVEVEVEVEESPLTEEYLAWFNEQVAQLVTEDDKPVDNLFSEKQQRLLAETLYTGWAPPLRSEEEEEQTPDVRHFWGAANVGLFPTIHQRDVIVPDVFLSLDVSVPDYPRVRSYFFWELGKPPDIVIEIVSNTKGGELSAKKSKYARLHIPYYVVYDPKPWLKGDRLHAFILHANKYERLERAYFPELGLGVVLWQGVYEMKEDIYLRWADREGNLLPTGKELAERESERAERESERAERESERAERLAAKLRELGIDPEQV